MEKHGLPLGLLRNLPRHLHEPIMVFDSATTPDSLVVMTELKHRGKTVVAAVHLAKRKERHEVNDMANIYGKDSKSAFAGWTDRGLFRYEERQKSGAWFQSIGLQLPKEGTTRQFAFGMQEGTDGNRSAGYPSHWPRIVAI